MPRDTQREVENYFIPIYRKYIKIGNLFAKIFDKEVVRTA
jgi:hypothetical protein